MVATAASTHANSGGSGGAQQNPSADGGDGCGCRCSQRNRIAESLVASSPALTLITSSHDVTVGRMTVKTYKPCVTRITRRRRETS